jgi:hypothetical protein
MKRIMLHKVISWLLLLYFAAVVIPPNASFTDTEKAYLSKATSLYEQAHNKQAEIYLFDLLFWQQISLAKRVERIADITGFVPGNNDGEAALLRIKAINLATDARCADLDRSTRLRLQHTPRTLYHMACIRYACSGISPPHLS